MSDITYEELILELLPLEDVHLWPEPHVGHYLWGIDTALRSSKAASSQPLMSDITYEELIHIIDKNKESMKVGHYLWGIDTLEYNVFMSSLFLMTPCVGHYLWGIDTIKLSTANIFAVDTYGRTLPMRNWYDFTLTTQLSERLMSRTLPMRNWYPSKSTYIQSSSSSDITYEELILAVQSSMRDLTIPHNVGHYLWGIDTLKFWGSWQILLCQSDITYEELIPFCLLMIKSILVLNVGHYLWGIDTFHRYSLHLNSYSFSFVGHYLWGIDTFSNPKSSSGNGFFSSDITYEELTRVRY